MIGWPTAWDPFCKHTHKPPVLCRVPWAASETSLSSASTSWWVHAVHRTVSCENLKFHMKLTLFRLLKPQHYIDEAEVWEQCRMKYINTDWPQGPKSIQLAWLRWQWWAVPNKQKITKREREKKKGWARHCFGYWQKPILLSTITEELAQTKCYDRALQACDILINSHSASAHSAIITKRVQELIVLSLCTLVSFYP